jgi:uncharacterized repeat protein (TIGR03803 family)
MAARWYIDGFQRKFVGNYSIRREHWGGAVIEFTPNSGGWKPKIVYSFLGGNDGASPTGNLAFDKQGNVYGATYWGGEAGTAGAGTVFKLTPVSGGWEESVIYNFNPGADKGGIFPSGGVIIDGSGNLYGVTQQGGTGFIAGGGCPYGCGTVYELSPTENGGWTQSTLYNFGASSNDGVYPGTPLTLDANGNLYGTAPHGGPSQDPNCDIDPPIGCGVVYELSPGASGAWAETILHNFNPDDGDGAVPSSGLIFDKAGNLYGTTDVGGLGQCSATGGGCGTVIRLSPSVGGKWTESVLYRFPLKVGNSPDSGVTFDGYGNLYGTTMGGGAYNSGIAFRLSPAISGEWSPSVIHSFGERTDGREPSTPLVMDPAGNFYGTTTEGGSNRTGMCGYNGVEGCGTVYEILP